MPQTYTVRLGDCISSIAFEKGFFPDTIWNDPQNSELRSQRSNPNALAEGDRIVIPDKRLKTESRPTSAEHRFRKRGVPAKLRIQFCESGKPCANLPFQLVIDGKHRFSGATDGEGWLIVSIPPNALDGQLALGSGNEERRYRLMLGHLPPPDTVKGVQARLTNMGLDCGPLDGGLNPQTRAAIRAFQAANELPVTGEASPEVCEKIREIHDRS